MASQRNVILSWVVIVGLSITASADGPSADANKPAAGEAKQAAATRVLITIRKETTVITKPLRKDGYPDYVAALNEFDSAGVTPENNAAVLLWNAIGPAPLRAQDRARFFRMLGASVPPMKGDYFVTLDSFVKQAAASKRLDAAHAAAEFAKADDELEAATKRPWSENDHPLLAQWLIANEKPLELVVAASHRTKLFDPLVVDENSAEMTALLPETQFQRHLARALVARAMLRLHERKAAEAWRDLLAVHRLARLTGRGPTLIHALVAEALDGIAWGGDQALVENIRLTSVDAMRMHEELEKLAPLPEMAEKIDRGERFMYLDSVAYAARNGFSSLMEVTNSVVNGGKPQSEATEPFVKVIIDLIARGLIDWNVPLRMGNSWYDRVVRTFHKSAERERLEDFRSIRSDLHRLLDEVKNWKPASLLNAGPDASRRMGDVLVCLILPAIESASRFELRSLTQFELAKLTFLLAAYRADHGEFPENLDQLVPKYAAKLPQDVFIADKLHYRRDGDGYLLYSVGFNEIDDGGKNADENNEDKDWDDIAVRVRKAP